MASIKSFTDISQSKKLAEILPLESADMMYHSVETEYGSGSFVATSKVITNGLKNDYFYIDDIPCWSLGALLGVMPQINEWITPYGHKNDKLSQFEPKICKIWEHSIVPSYKVTYGNELSTDIYDNPVDACYEMILKLKEKNLL